MIKNLFIWKMKPLLIYLLLVSSISCTAFITTFHEATHRSCSAQRSRGFPSAVSEEARASSNETLGIAEVDLGVEENDTPKSKFSKAKWKKKRFLLLQDVKKLIREKSPHAAKKAEEMVHRMLNLYDKSGGDDDLRPTLQAYNLWIHAIAKSNQANAGQLAERVLKEMQENNIVPDAITYSSIMDAYARSKNPELAEDVLFRLLDGSSNAKGVSSIQVDTILNAWAQQGTYESAERAQLILLRLENWQQNEIRPTKISYATVMNAWARVRSTDAAEHAESLLKRMLKTNHVKPDVVVFNAVINAWATSRDPQAGKRAVTLLKQMQKLAAEGFDSNPDIVTYNTVLSAWAHSGNENAARHCERIVQDMHNAANSSKSAPSPNTITYNNILHAWCKSQLPGAAPRAQEVLDHMLKSKSFSPDVISFASVLEAWAKSKEPNKSSRCRDLLYRMIAMYHETGDERLRPTPYNYNAVLNACAFSALGTPTEEQREALQIAVQTYSAMRQSDTPVDTVTHGNMLKCIANLVPEGELRSNMALQVFDKCIEDGLVGPLAWSEVRRAVPSKQLAKIYRLKGLVGSLQVRDLPQRWRKANRSDKNLSRAKRRRKRKAQESPHNH